MYKNEHPDQRFSKKSFEWSSHLAFDSAENASCQHQAPHTRSVIDANAALHGRWDEVIVAGVDGTYIDFATGDGFRRMWSHEPDVLAIVGQRVDAGDDVWWSEDQQLVAVTFEDMTLMIGLDEGTATECEVREPTET